MLIAQGVFAKDHILDEVNYFIRELGMDNIYFELCNKKQIAKHIHGLMCAKKTAQINRTPESIQITMSEEDSSFFICSSNNQLMIEKQVEKILGTCSLNKSISVIYQRSKNPIIKGGKNYLDLYITKQLEYVNQQSNEIYKGNDVYKACNVDFHQRPQKAIERYQVLLKQACENVKPIAMEFKTENDEICLMFGVNQGITNEKNVKHFTYISELSKNLESMKIEAHKKYVESFSNGIVVYSFYFQQKLNEQQINSFKNVGNLLFTLPFNDLTPLFLNDHLTGRQFLYAYSASRFAYYFAQQKHEEFDALYDHLDKTNSKMKNKLINLRQIMQKENFSIYDIYRMVENNQNLVKELYTDFARRMRGELPGFVYSDINQLIQKVKNPKEQLIMNTFYIFNKSVVKTNFYNTSKSATAFRLDPSIMCKNMMIPEIPFGIFLILGRDFNGFHIRFRDIARGGIRIIKSTYENYGQNRITQFNETYNLAYTQKLKNKDIAESGSKGTILLKSGKNHTSQLSFDQYIDALTDLKLVVDGVIDNYKKPEFLFMGPDENSADLMDQAALLVKKKGYNYWKSFTTGKSSSLGGIPHDKFGMTTRSIRQFTLGIQKKLNLISSDCTKFMTGGPDGDLGSNEIKMGTEKICAIVDGSGVLYDPQGIDREALLKLVHQRKMISHYDGKLSDQGFKILISDENITLPNGKVVENGIQFRNSFHLEPYVLADFMIPCGGRPESININNVEQLFQKDGTPRFKYIVEGANLFITESARHILEDRGVILFKDASTNKGGVTSSSMEVLASLCMNDEEFARNMIPQSDGSIPQFYKDYVQDIIRVIEENARKEFEYIYERKQSTGYRSVEITNELSENMNNLFDIIVKSDLFLQENIKRNVMADIIPNNLLNLVGLETILNRVPQSYQRSLFAKFLSKEYYYDVGSQSNVYNFYEFMKKYSQ